MTYTFQKDAGKRDFVNAIQRANSTKLGANHYKIHDAGGFIGKENIKKVPFAFNKEIKTSVLEVQAKKQAWVPGPNAYSPNSKKKAIGNYLQKDVTRGIFTEAELAGKSTPSVYNLSNMEKYKTAAPSCDWKISKTIRIQPLKKTPADRSEVSPSSYKYDESLKKRIFTSEPKYS